MPKALFDVTDDNPILYAANLDDGHWVLERIRYGTQLITIEMAYDNDVFESALDQCGSSSLRGVLGFSLMATCMSVVKLSWDKQEFQYPEQMIADTSCTLDVDLSDWGLVQDVGEGVTLVS